MQVCGHVLDAGRTARKHLMAETKRKLTCIHCKKQEEILWGKSQLFTESAAKAGWGHGERDTWICPKCVIKHNPEEAVLPSTQGEEVYKIPIDRSDSPYTIACVSCDKSATFKREDVEKALIGLSNIARDDYMGCAAYVCTECLAKKLFYVKPNLSKPKTKKVWLVSENRWEKFREDAVV